MDEMTARLVDYALAVDGCALEPAVVEACKIRLLDTLGCAFGGFAEAPCVAARALAGEYSGARTAGIVGSGATTTAEMAAFANGVMFRFLDMNDMYRSKSGGHPSDVIAAVLAMAEAVHADGRSFLGALALAYEIFCAFCESVDINSQGWDQPVYVGLASAVACAKLLGLSRNAMADAVSLALVPNMALLQTRRGELSAWKGCAAANGSRNAVFAALMAEKGFGAPAEPFEGRDGLWRVVGRFDWAALPVGGSPRRITGTHLKAFALGYHGQSAAWAARELHGRVPVDEIAAIRIESYRAAVDMMGTDASRWSPQTRETADHSLPYVVATVLVDGTIDEASFADAKLHDPRTVGLMGRTTVVEDAALSAQYPATAPCRITIETRAGEEVSAIVRHPKGHSGNPMSRGEVRDKFRRLAAGCLDGAQSESLMDRIDGLESLPDVCDLLRTVRLKEST